MGTVTATGIGPASLALLLLAVWPSSTIAGHSTSLEIPAALRATAEPTRTLLPDGRTLVVGVEAKRASAFVEPLSGSAAPLQLSAPRFARTHHTTTVLPHGLVLLWGGIDERGELIESGEWFSPEANAFSSANALGLLPRAGHTATVLTDGRLLVTGGWNAKLGLLTEAELWDYRSQRSELLAKELTPPRLGHSATLLPDGRVLILGGFDATGNRYADAALYDAERVAFVDLDAGTAGRLAHDDPSTANAPKIAATIPRALATNFPPNGLLAIRFSVPMDIATLTSSAITLVGREGAVSLRAIGAEAGRLLFVRPTTDLYPGSRYTLFVDGPKALAGQRLPFTAITFSTAVLTSATAMGEALRSAPSTLASEAEEGRGEPEQTVAAATGSTSANADQSVSADAATAEIHLTTGVEEAAQRVACQYAAKAHEFCRDQALRQDGYWLPGKSSQNGEWRINGTYPPEPDERLLRGRTVEKGATALYGQVLRIDDQPVAHVTVSIGTVATRTDVDGVFLLTNPPVGPQELLVDGYSARVGDAEYGEFIVGVDIKAGAVQPVPHRMYIPRVSARDKVSIPSPTKQETVITHPEMPGLEIRIPADTVIKDRDGHAVTELAFVPMPVDRTMFPVPANFPSYFAIQPAGAVIHGLTPKAAQGVRIIYPNHGHDPVGARHELWAYGPRDGWKRYSYGTVSQDRKRIHPDKDGGQHDHMGAGHGLAGGASGPPVKPEPGDCNAIAGDPIDCGTGLFIYTRTDLRISDILDLEASRTYRPGDSVARSFGKGTSHPYAIYLYNPNPPNKDNPTIILPDGAAIVFSRISGSQTHDSIWQHTDSQSIYYGAKMTAPSTPDEHWLVTLKDGTRFEFSIASGNALRAIRDRYGNTIQLSFIGGLLSKTTSPSGRFLSYTYGAGNRISSIADSTGRSVSYTYNAAGLLETVTYPNSTTESYTYNSNGEMLTVVDPRGNTIVTNTYSNGRVATQTLADNSVYQLAYTVDGNGNVTQTDVTDPLNRVRRIVFHSSGYRATDTHAYGNALAQTTTFERLASGLVTAKIDALGRRTEYTYDAVGNILTETYLAGTGNAIQYQFAYSPDFNQIVSKTNPLSQTTTFGYTAGCLTSITDPLNHVTNITCNSAGQTLSRTDALNQTTTYAYNGYDLRTITDALSRTMTLTTDTLGRVIATQDPLGNMRRAVYDQLDRVTHVYDAQYQQTTMAYDNNGNLTALTDAKNATTLFTYDSRNRRTTRTDAESQDEVWTYDGLGNIVSYDDRKLQTTTYDYDALHRRTLTTYSDSSTVGATYDAGNRVTLVQDSSSGNISWSYDGLDRVTQETTPQGTVSYSYDTAGKRTAMTAAAQAAVAYTYDAASRLTRIDQGSEAVVFGYDYADRRTQLTLPNSIVVSYTYDAVYQITAMSFTPNGGSALGTLSYSYDALGRRTAQGGTWASEQLATATTADGDFDLNNRQTEANGTTLTYDSNGSLTDDGVTTYTWDARNRLTQMQRAPSYTASFEYDALGRRTSRTISNGTTVTTTYLYDDATPVQETEGSTVNPILGGIGIDEYYARNDSSGRTYFLSDAMGSTMALTDSNAAVRRRYHYEPYGEVAETGDTGPFNNSYQFTGRENDKTGLYFYRARYYSPALKRFISDDPIGQAGGLNSYRYSGANPITFSDPSGLDPSNSFMTPWGAAVGAIRHIWATYEDSGKREYCGYVTWNSDWTFSYRVPNAGKPREEVPDWAHGMCNTGKPCEGDVAWYHNQITKADMSGSDKIDTDRYDVHGFSGFRKPDGTEDFHYFDPKWNVDTSPSVPILPW